MTSQLGVWVEGTGPDSRSSIPYSHHSLIDLHKGAQTSLSSRMRTELAAGAVGVPPWLIRMSRAAETSPAALTVTARASGALAPFVLRRTSSDFCRSVKPCNSGSEGLIDWCSDQRSGARGKNGQVDPAQSRQPEWHAGRWEWSHHILELQNR